MSGCDPQDRNCIVLDLNCSSCPASSTFMAEALALKKGVQKAKAVGLREVRFESDYENLVKVVQGRSDSPDWRSMAIAEDVIC